MSYALFLDDDQETRFLPDKPSRIWVIASIFQEATEIVDARGCQGMPGDALSSSALTMTSVRMPMARTCQVVSILRSGWSSATSTASRRSDAPGSCTARTHRARRTSKVFSGPGKGPRLVRHSARRRLLATLACLNGSVAAFLTQGTARVGLSDRGFSPQVQLRRLRFQLGLASTDRPTIASLLLHITPNRLQRGASNTPDVISAMPEHRLRVEDG